MNIRMGYKKFEVEAFQKLNVASFSENERADPGKFLSLLATHDVFVARDLPVTTYGAEIGDTIYGYGIVDPGQSANLRILCVAPGWHGRGIGGNILREVLHYYGKTSKNVRLHVHVDNAAQKLYHDYGFRVYDIESNYYGPGQTALMMRHTFKGK